VHLPWVLSLRDIKINEFRGFLEIYHQSLSSSRLQFIKAKLIQNPFQSPALQAYTNKMSIKGLMLRGVALGFWLGVADAGPRQFPLSSPPLSTRSSQLVGCNGDQETKIRKALADMANLALNAYHEAERSNLGYAGLNSELIYRCYNSNVLGTHITFWIMSSTFLKRPWKSFPAITTQQILRINLLSTATQQMTR
jgi:hypothetical protein